MGRFDKRSFLQSSTFARCNGFSSRQSDRFRIVDFVPYRFAALGAAFRGRSFRWRRSALVAWLGRLSHRVRRVSRFRPKTFPARRAFLGSPPSQTPSQTTSPTTETPPGFSTLAGRRLFDTLSSRFRRRRLAFRSLFVLFFFFYRRKKKSGFAATGTGGSRPLSSRTTIFSRCFSRYTSRLGRGLSRRRVGEVGISRTHRR